MEEAASYDITNSLDVVTFLEDYEQLPCLWDKLNPNFKKKIERTKAEHLLLEAFNFPDIITLRRKIRSIRGTYNNEMRKVRASIRNGIGEVYVPKLFWFKQANKFLRSTMEGDSELKLDNLEEPKKNIDNDLIIPYASFTSSLVIPEDETPTQDKKIKVIRKRRFKKCEDNSLGQALRALTQVSKREFLSCTTNEFAAFGNSVGLQLQKMPLELAIEVQSEIQAVISNARLRHIRMNSIKMGSHLSS